jgi:hypothetical protein
MHPQPIAAFDVWLLIDATIVVLVVFALACGLVWFVRRKRPVVDAADSPDELSDLTAPEDAGGGLAEPELAPTSAVVRGRTTTPGFCFSRVNASHS